LAIDAPRRYTSATTYRHNFSDRAGLLAVYCGEMRKATSWPRFDEEKAMAKCDVCGNDYDKTFQIVRQGQTMTFDSFECAIHAMAPICTNCSCRIIGHGLVMGSRKTAKFIAALTAQNSKARPRFAIARDCAPATTRVAVFHRGNLAMTRRRASATFANRCCSAHRKRLCSSSSAVMRSGSLFWRGMPSALQQIFAT
jgi:hypothetical protein